MYKCPKCTNIRNTNVQKYKCSKIQMSENKIFRKIHKCSIGTNVRKYICKLFDTSKVRKYICFVKCSNFMLFQIGWWVDLSVNVSCNNLYSCTYLFIEDVNTSSLYLIKIKFEHFTKTLYFRTFSCGTIVFSNNFY